jgi:4-amino-4-deoxy-L-arabinose transferase-like glycosyltransferase
LSGAAELRPRLWANKGFWPFICILLCLFATRQVYSLLQESETIDEGVHLVAGYSYWKTHDFRLVPSHPPLAELLNALPLIFLNPDFSPNPDDWQNADEYAVAKQFLYQNRISADTLLLAGRSMTVVIALGFGVILASWTRRRFGEATAIFVVFLYTLSPNFLAHGHYVTTDMMVSALIVWSCLSWLDYLEYGTTNLLFRTGLLVGLAFASKFTGLILYPVLFLVYLAYRRLKPTASRWRHSVKISVCALVVLPGMIVYSTFFFDTRSLREDPRLGPRFADKQGLTRLVAEVPIPAYYYFRGLHLLLRDMQGGHDGYLLGKSFTRGSWAYFPVAFVVKTTASTLALLVLCFILATARMRNRPDQVFLWVALGSPPLVYFLVSMTSTLNIGVRHLLPVYPFLYILISAVLFAKKAASYRRISRPIGLVLGVTLMVESMSIAPDYLAYFNVLAGGPQNGPKYLIDSNLDWGQGLKKLKRWKDRHSEAPLCLSYFGQANPEYYGIEYRTLESLRNLDEVMKINCVVAISAHLLYGTGADRFRVLQDFIPDDHVGHAIYIYDFRKIESAGPAAP